MQGTLQQIKVNKLVNYAENPRHAVGTNEKDTLEKLFNAVGIQYMLNLAKDIQQNGLLGNQQIVVVSAGSSGKYIVYEGNRRVAAIKLLLDPQKFTFLDKATKEKAMKKVASPLTTDPTADIVVFIMFPAPFPSRLIPHLIA